MASAIDGSQDIEVQSHLKTCPDCSELVSDLKMIASEARHLSASERKSRRRECGRGLPSNCGRRA